MPSLKKEKHYANSRARRHSGDIVITQSKKSKKDKDKDTDTESVSSSTTSTTETAVPATPESKKCPLRFVMAGMMEKEEGEEKAKGCPLRRVQLWHTIPLCLLAIVNLLLVIIALLGLAGYRITMGCQGLLISLARTELECNPYAESLADTDDSPTLVEEKH